MPQDTVCPSAQDGDATLLAVLSFLDAHDTAEGFGETTRESPLQSFGSDSGTSPKSSGTSDTPEPLTRSTKKPQRKTNAAGQQRQRPAVHSDTRQRAEMIALREESLALQDRVDEIKSQVMVQPRPNKKRTIEDPDGERKGELRRLRARAWQAMAETQKKRREGAEHERAHLRELIDQQKKLFRQLRRYLVRHADKHKALGEIARIALEVDHEDHTTTASSSDTDEADFEQISSTIPTMLLQTGALFTDARLANVTTSLRDLKVQNEASHKMSIEALESSVVPFDVTTTASAVWQHHLTKAYRIADTAHDHRDTIDMTDWRIRRTFQVAVDNNGTALRARGRMETRRYIESDRVVVVQSSIVDRIELSTVPLPNFAIRHFQWTVIRAPRHAMLRWSGKPLSQVEIYGVNMPTISELPESSVRDAVKRGCVESVGLQLEFERQSVENILMQKCVQGANVDRTMLHVPQW